MSSILFKRTEMWPRTFAGLACSSLIFPQTSFSSACTSPQSSLIIALQIASTSFDADPAERDQNLLTFSSYGAALRNPVCIECVCVCIKEKSTQEMKISCVLDSKNYATMTF